MNNQLKVFNHNQFGELRTVYNKKSDDVWFVGKDIARPLGYKNISDALSRHVDIEDKDEIGIHDSIGRKQNTPIINESGMYSLILRSNLPQAKQFKRWVTSEVLPSIRKHGGYMLNQENQSPDEILANAVLVAKRVIAEKERELQAKDEKLEIQKPKVEYFDKVLNTKGSMTATQAAKALGLKSAIQLNNMLHELGIQYKQSGQWHLYSKYAGKGYTETSTHIYEDGNGVEKSSKATKWTEKGLNFIYEELNKHGLIKEG